MQKLYRNITFKLLNIFFLFVTTISGQESCTTPALESGFCVTYKDCPFATDLVNRYGSSQAIPDHLLKYIFKSKCSRDNEPIRLCCTLPQKPTTAQQTNDPRLTEDLDYKNQDFISQFNPKGLDVLNKLECGKSGADRVVGGVETELAEFPWMALLRYDSPNDEFQCGGSLITNRYVLTATHCVNKDLNPVIGVRLGEHDLSSNPDCRPSFRRQVCVPVVEDFGIEKIISHPRYNERRTINDVALVKIDRDVEFKKHIKPVCLPITKQSFALESNTFTIAGWGGIENKATSSVLMKAKVLGQRYNVCQNLFSNIQISQKHICAGDIETGRDTCKGDSGGPLFSINSYEENKRYIQYGIVASGGLACNLTQKFPGIYTNVLTYLPWITSNILD